MEKHTGFDEMFQEANIFNKRYKKRKELGEGGYAKIFLCDDLGLELH